MADLMWGGVPFRVPSKTAMKYMGGHRAVPDLKRECDIPVGGRYNARKTMEREIPGHKTAHRDLRRSYEKFEEQRRRARSEPEPDYCSGVSSSQLSAGHEYVSPLNPIYYHEKSCSFRATLTRCPLFKPRVTVGMTEPRVESYIGLTDLRKRLPGYLGGKRCRDPALSGVGLGGSTYTRI